jgi:hypothetical protein
MFLGEPASLELSCECYSTPLGTVSRPTLIADHKAPLFRSAERRCHRTHTHLKGQKQKPSGRYTERLFFAPPSLLVLSLGSNLLSQT